MKVIITPAHLTSLRNRRSRAPSCGLGHADVPVFLEPILHSDNESDEKTNHEHGERDETHITRISLFLSCLELEKLRHQRA